jgi:hypothetical protein
MRRFLSFAIPMTSVTLPAVVALIVLGPTARFSDLPDGGAGWIITTILVAFTGVICGALLSHREPDYDE